MAVPGRFSRLNRASSSQELDNSGYRWKSSSGDDSESVRWYRRAAEQGHASAQLNLGTQYVLGEGVPRDIEEGEKWYMRAADQGLADAQIALGLLYESISEVPDNYVFAHFWLRLSVQQGNDSAREELERIEKLMTTEQIDEARELWREWKMWSEPTPTTSVQALLSRPVHG